MSSRSPSPDEELLRSLLAVQVPRWATLSVSALDDSAASDHALFRLGDGLVARLPRRPSAAQQVDKEQRWLPFLAERLSVPIPTVAARGRPAGDYPWPWSIYEWLPGRPAAADAELDPGFGDDLARFIAELHAVVAARGPDPGAHNGHRGAALATRADEVEGALAALDEVPDLGLDLERARRVWADALDASAHDGPPRWIHGDLLPGNVLLDDHARLHAVIDFGCLGVGDPACDVMAAWTILPAEQRGAFRARLEVDDDTWRRGRGWAVSFGLIALPYHRQRTPALAAVAHQAIRASTSPSIADDLLF